MKKTLVLFIIICPLLLGCVQQDQFGDESADQPIAPAGAERPEIIEAEAPAQPEDMPSPDGSTGEQPSFVLAKTGTILNWDSATETHTDDWYFLFDEPGAAASRVKLLLYDVSICDLEGDEAPCPEEGLDDSYNGRRATVDGIQVGDELTVSKLTLE